MIDLETHTRRQAEVDAEIRRDQAQHAEVIAEFHKVFYASRQTHGMTYYHGVPVMKNPLDLWVYQEIIWDLRPTLIVETGTAWGGSAMFYADQLDYVQEGHVITIDPEPHHQLPVHPRLTSVRGSSTDPAVVMAVREAAKTHPRVMVTLDSDHSCAHVTQELLCYADLVTPGQFLVVEDVNINGRPVPIDWKGGPGPGPAVDAWLPDHPEFQPAAMAERYLLTMHAWLKRGSPHGTAA